MNPHPLATLIFIDPDGFEIERHWYHVPRVGDHILLTYEPQPDVREPVAGEITSIEWREDEIHVRYR